MTPRAARLLRRSLLGAALLAAVGYGGIYYTVGGLRNLIGLLRYDQREEGTLQVGDLAPDPLLTALDGSARSSLLAGQDGRPLVLIFGSFT